MVLVTDSDRDPASGLTPQGRPAVSWRKRLSSESASGSTFSTAIRAAIRNPAQSRPGPARSGPALSRAARSPPGEPVDQVSLRPPRRRRRILASAAALADLQLYSETAFISSSEYISSSARLASEYAGGGGGSWPHPSRDRPARNSSRGRRQVLLFNSITARQPEYGPDETRGRRADSAAGSPDPAGRHAGRTARRR
jgi:hypothetical protein